MRRGSKHGEVIDAHDLVVESEPGLLSLGARLHVTHAGRTRSTNTETETSARGTSNNDLKDKNVGV